MSRYAKTIVAAIGAGALAAQAALSDGTITQAEWVTVGIAVLAACGVYFVPNKKQGDGS